MNIECHHSDFGPAKGWFALAAAVPKRSPKTQISLGFYSCPAPAACPDWDGRELVALIKCAPTIGGKNFVKAPMALCGIGSLVALVHLRVPREMFRHAPLSGVVSPATCPPFRNTCDYGDNHDEQY